MKIMEVLTFVGAVLGAICLFLSFASANGAPQEAALAATAVAFVVLPYCVASVLHRRRLRE